VRSALSTLPWVEKGTIKADVRRQQVRFAVKDEESFDLAEAKEAIEGRTNYKVGKVVSGP
jgi:hypothetical protein